MKKYKRQALLLIVLCLVLVAAIVLGYLHALEYKENLEAQNSVIESMDREIACLKQEMSRQKAEYTEREEMLTQEIRKLESEGVVVVSYMRYSITPEELDLLARCCQSEAGYTAYESQRKILHVILNRVDSDKFPDTVTEVIYQEGQFDVVNLGMIDTPATEETLENIKNELLYNAESVPEDVLFFHSSSIDSDVNRVVWYRCEGTTFTY